MKKVEIKQFSHAEISEPKEPMGFFKIHPRHELIRAEGENLEVSDGYHTFDELYDHRMNLYISLCRNINYINAIWEKNGTKMTGERAVWRSKNHSDGEIAFGGTWFVLGIGKNKGTQITYHLPIERWESLDSIETLEKAPEWDGHTSQDVLERLKNL